MSSPSHPYRSLPEKAFWRKSVAGVPAAEVDPVGSFTLKIAPETKVATAGSCFAQHIARHLKASGFNYYVAEPGHPVIPQDLRLAHNYGTFSARYGNIYTARQLRQLFDRVQGTFVPREAAWIDPDGSVRDPFRPTVQPGNFASVAEMEADRRQHLAAVKRMFETLDVFVFTLGLTECWRSNEDGAVFPLCPGVEGGTFNPKRYVFHNQGVVEVFKDMQYFLDGLKSINPQAKVILTVSPVPLMATAVDQAHVLSATTYSKSLLRVAAQMLVDKNDWVHYFPSYEVITGAYTRGRYFAEDLRNVTEEGVSHVMRLFLRHAAGIERPAPAAATTASAPAPVAPAPVAPAVPVAAAKSAPSDAEARQAAHASRAEAFVQVECDEEGLDRDAP